MHKPRLKAIDNFKPFQHMPKPKFCKTTVGTDGKESAGFACGVFWGVVVSVPIWALLYWIFIW